MNSAIKDRIDKIEEGIVPEGYKKTKLGIIPEDWEVKKLDEVSIDGGTYGINAAAVQYKDELPKYLRITDISDDGRYLDDDKKSVNNKDYKKFILNDDDIVFARTGNTTGKTYLYNKDDGELVYAGFLIKFSIDPQIANSKYIYENTKTNLYRTWVKVMSARSGQPGINSKEYESLRIALPPLQEQEKIADILSTRDKAIENIEKLIQEKLTQKKGLMQELLTGKTRLPGFTGEWEEVKLGDVSKIITGTTPSTKLIKYYGSQYPWVTPTDIGNEKYIKKTERSLSEEGIKVGRFVPKGSLLITCIASIGKNVILEVDGSCNQQINAIYPSDKHSNEYFYYMIGYNKNYLLSYASKTATLMVNKNTFEKIKFVIPPLAEQKAIAEILSTADKEIELLNKLLENKKEEKKGLMQLLLTGIVRV